MTTTRWPLAIKEEVYIEGLLQAGVLVRIGLLGQ